MILHWPQIVLLVLNLLGLGICLEQHGKLKKGEHNAWSTIIATLILFWLLYEGGFFG